MTTAPAAQDKNNTDLKARAQEIATLIWYDKVDEAIKKFRDASNDDRYAILMDRDACVLHLAAGCNSVDAITAMLAGLSLDQRLAAITAVNTEGYTPLHRAAQNGPADAITAMLDGLSADRRLAVITAVDTNGYTPLDVAAAFDRVGAITAMLAGLNVAQCRDALFNEQHGVAIKLAQRYAADPQDINAQGRLNTLIKGVSALETSDGTDEQGLSENDKKGLITGILQEMGKRNLDAEIPSAAAEYLACSKYKTVGDCLQGLQGSFAQAATTTTAVPTNTPEATIGNAGGYRCPVKRGFDGNPVSRRNYPGCDR
jgi:hypothetical protein